MASTVSCRHFHPWTAYNLGAHCATCQTGKLTDFSEALARPPHCAGIPCNQVACSFAPNRLSSLEARPGSVRVMREAYVPTLQLLRKKSAPAVNRAFTHVGSK
jgi:hypothetical protein